MVRPTPPHSHCSSPDSDDVIAVDENVQDEDMSISSNSRIGRVDNEGRRQRLNIGGDDIEGVNGNDSVVIGHVLRSIRIENEASKLFSPQDVASSEL